MDERTNGRTDERTNEKAAVEVATAEKEEEEEEKKARDSRQRSLLRTTRTLRDSAGIVLVLSGHWSAPKQPTNKREIEVCFRSLRSSWSGEFGGRERTPEEGRRNKSARDTMCGRRNATRKIKETVRL